jgi:urease accessory protein
VRQRTMRNLQMLLQMASPALPVGAFAYSQGIERAVEDGLIRDAEDAKRWILDVLEGPMTHWEAPAWLRMHRACLDRDHETFLQWNERFVASRETSELRAETLQMGASLAAWACELGLDIGRTLRAIPELSFTGGFAACAASSAIAEHEGVVAYVWSWIENQVTAAIKAVPLGQMAAQRLLLAAHAPVRDAVATAAGLDDASMHSAAPGLALSCARHEMQYSRLFRS